MLGVASLGNICSSANVNDDDDHHNNRIHLYGSVQGLVAERGKYGYELPGCIENRESLDALQNNSF
jgi:hypothetical protein